MGRCRPPHTPKKSAFGLHAPYTKAHGGAIVLLSAKDIFFQTASDSLREFVRTAVILTPAREASRVGTALCRQDPEDPVECSFFLEFETPIEVERSEARI